MKMRTIGQSPTKSVRMSKQEWEDIKNAGDKVFKNRNVGYMQVQETRIIFETESPYFKDKKSKDKANQL